MITITVIKYECLVEIRIRQQKYKTINTHSRVIVLYKILQLSPLLDLTATYCLLNSVKKCMTYDIFGLSLLTTKMHKFIIR